RPPPLRTIAAFPGTPLSPAGTPPAGRATPSPRHCCCGGGGCPRHHRQRQQLAGKRRRGDKKLFRRRRDSLALRPCQRQPRRRRRPDTDQAPRSPALRRRLSVLRRPRHTTGKTHDEAETIPRDPRPSHRSHHQPCLRPVTVAGPSGFHTREQP
ncbi:unnamed protein product, partial [Ectocarpus fasciculatus]